MYTGRKVAKSLIFVIIPAILGWWGSVAFSAPWTWKDLSIWLFVAALLLWVGIVLFLDIRGGKRAEEELGEALTDFGNQIFNARNALEVLQALPKARSKLLAELLAYPEPTPSCCEFVEDFLGESGSIEDILASAAFHMQQRKDSCEHQPFRLALSVPTDDPDRIGTQYSFAHESDKRPEIGRTYARDSSTTAGCAWLKEHTIALSNIPELMERKRAGSLEGELPFQYFTELERKAIKSILSIPIFSTDGPARVFHGVLTVDTDVPGFFAPVKTTEQYYWDSVLAPFVNRIIFYQRLTKAAELVLRANPEPT